MKRLILIPLFIFSEAHAFERAPTFAETHCAHALVAMNNLPLIQISDLYGKVASWPLTDAAKAELEKDLLDHRVNFQVASLKGPALDRFAKTFLPDLDRLDQAVAESRRETATHLTSGRRLVAASVAVVVASLSALAMYGDQNWVAAVAGNGALLGAGVLLWRAHFNSTYAEASESPVETLRHAHARTTLVNLRISDGLTEFKNQRDAVNVRAWLRRDLVREITRTRHSRASVEGIDASIEFNRRWGWLDLVLPGRQRVNVTYFLSRDEKGDKRLTVVTRTKPR